MGNKLNKILAEISAGELFDKITILEIKKEKISNKEKLVDVEKELNSLNDTAGKFIPDQSNISLFYCHTLDVGRNPYRKAFC